MHLQQNCRCSYSVEEEAGNEETPEEEQDEVSGEIPMVGSGATVTCIAGDRG